MTSLRTTRPRVTDKTYPNSAVIFKNLKMPSPSNRALLEISGTDSKKFLQGLVTNDVYKASKTNLIYAAMLNAQGRFLYDFFLFEKGDKLMLDCHATKRDEILKKLNFYKLRADVSLQKNDELLVAQSFSNHGFEDPRSKKLGYRIYTTKEELSASNADLMSLETYNFLRIENKIAEGESDLTSDKSLILEFGFEDLHAISYEKGCYIGQELTARTHYKGEIRKKLFHIKIANKTSVEKGAEISCAGKSVGIILSSIFHKNELHALALVRLPDNLEDKNFMQNLEFENSKISIII